MSWSGSRGRVGLCFCASPMIRHRSVNVINISRRYLAAGQLCVSRAQASNNSYIWCVAQITTPCYWFTKIPATTAHKPENADNQRYCSNIGIDWAIISDSKVSFRRASINIDTMFSPHVRGYHFDQHLGAGWSKLWTSTSKYVIARFLRRSSVWTGIGHRSLSWW